MQPQDMVRILIKRGWVVVLAVVLTMACALGFSRLQTPIYRSTVYLNVWPARIDLSLQQTIKGLMRNYAGSITSREVAMKVVDDLQLDITPEQFRAKLTVDPIESDFMIQIDVDDYDPLLARDIAQHTAEVFVEDTRVYMVDQDQRDRIEVTILDNALPGHLHKPKPVINLLAGGVLGPCWAWPSWAWPSSSSRARSVRSATSPGSLCRSLAWYRRPHRPVTKPRAEEHSSHALISGGTRWSLSNTIIS